jgi:ABC-2 type transport system permease protein
MIATIAFKELRDTWRDGRFRIGGALLLVLLVVSGVLAWQQTERTRNERYEAAQLDRLNWLHQGEKNSHSAGHYGVYAFKPTAPLSAFDRGIEPYVGNTVFLEAHRRNSASFLPAQDATNMRRFGELTASVSLQILLPLLVILLAFGTLAGERERGTLRQVLSLGVDPVQLVVGKFIGLFLAVALLLAPLVLLGGWLMSGAGEQQDPALAKRILLLSGAYASYLGVFLALAVAISARARSARGALTLLLGLWAFNCVLAPRLSSDLVDAWLPTRDLTSFEDAIATDLKKGLDGHDSRDAHLRQFTRDTLAKYGKQTVAELPFNFNGLVMLESEKFSSEVYGHHYALMWDQMEAQDRAMTLAGLAAPLLALRTASMSLSGTDLRQHRYFADASEVHRMEFMRVLNEDLMNNALPEDRNYRAGRELWEQLPPFELAPRDFGAVWSDARLALGILAAWFCVAFLWLWSSARRLRLEAA